MIFAANQAINEVEEFRYRIRGDQVILHDTVHASFTDMTEGSDLFKIVIADMEADMSHTISLNRDDSIPRVSWGKYFNDGDQSCCRFRYRPTIRLWTAST